MKTTIKIPPLTLYQQDVWKWLANSSGSGKVCVIKSIRQSGKSFLMCMLLINVAFTKQTVSAIYEPTLNQAREMFRHFIDYFQNSRFIKTANASLLEIEFVNGSRILFKSTEQSSRGFTISGILILDEAAYLREDEINVILPTTNVYNSPIVIVSTPAFTSGFFYDMYQEGLSNDNDKIKTFDWSSHPDVEHFLTPERKEYYRKTMNKLKYQTEVLGQFITEGSYLFGDVVKCVRKTNKQPIYGAIDWATGNNGDYTWLTLMDEDKNVTSVYYIKDIEPNEQITYLTEILRKINLKKLVVEENSIGTVYYSYLKKSLPKHNIVKFTTTNESKRRIIEQLIKAFQNNDIGIVEDKELVIQLQHYQVEKTKTGKVTYNATSGFHDDGVMSLAICYDASENNKGSYAITSKKHRI